jgi:hypothetical protein
MWIVLIIASEITEFRVIDSETSDIVHTTTEVDAHNAFVAAHPDKFAL